MYGKIINEELIYAPRNYKTDEGQLIINFNTNVTLMMAQGFKEVIKEIPTYDKTTHTIQEVGYEENEDCIRILYELVERDYSSMDRLSDVEERVKHLENMNEYYGVILFEEANNRE